MNGRNTFKGIVVAAVVAGLVLGNAAVSHAETPNLVYGISVSGAAGLAKAI